MQATLSNSLFFHIDKSEPLANTEKESYSILNEIWGDDEDKVYSRHTHYHLTRNIKSHGL